MAVSDIFGEKKQEQREGNEKVLTHSERSGCLRKKIHGSGPGDLGGERMSVLHSQPEHCKVQGERKGSSGPSRGSTPYTPSEAGLRCQLRITESIRLEKSSETIKYNP